MRWIVLLLWVAGCRQLLGFGEPVTGEVDAPSSCALPGPCASGGVCKLPDGVCVECIENIDCPSSAPVCNLATNTCELCNEHADCSSNACLPSGACADSQDVAYVAANGSGNPDEGCTIDLPCPSIILALATTKATIKVSGAIATNIVTTIGRDVVILADPGARLGRVTAGPIVEVSAGNVEIYDLELSEASGASGHGVSVSGSADLTLERVFIVANGGRGLEAVDAKKITLRRCVIATNANGGVSLAGVSFEISNTLIVRNGSASSAFGGFRVTGQDASSTFSFNTVANNASTNSLSSGVDCDNGFVASSNIVADNGVELTCTFNFSLFSGVVPSGTGNVSGAPRFITTSTANVSDLAFYRLEATSDAIDKADPAATLTIDLDGQARPQGTTRDMGADEFVP